MREIANCICEFVLAARRWLQPCDEFKNARPKRVQTGVIPGACWFAWLWFFAKIDELHLLVHKNRTAFADVFAARNGDNRFTIIRKIDEAFVIYGTDQNIAIAQNKWRAAGEVAGKIDNAARTVLHRLRSVFDFDIMMPAITKKVPHHFRMIANDNYKSAYARIAQSFYNVLQNRFAAHLNHRFRKINSE